MLTAYREKVTSTAAPEQRDETAWRRMRVWASAHAVDDFYQGLIPAAIPFFVLQHGYSYLAASGLSLAATLGSALPQPLIGLLADRFVVPWLPALGVALAGTGAGLAGLGGSYPVVFALLLASGFGVALFHPPAGRDARRDAGNSATAMSYFATGGKVGFFLAPVLATPALVAHGVGAMAWFIPPAVLMGYVVLRHQRRIRQTKRGVATLAGDNQWRQFSLLSALEIVRSTVSFGISTFIGLYWIVALGAPSWMSGVALASFFVGGIAGTLIGGRLGDRFGLVTTNRLGAVALVPAVALVIVLAGPWTGLPLLVLAGLVTNLPFAVLVKLGQDYLPQRPGTASGMTLGIAVSAGGLFLPVLGAVADAHGPRAALIVLCAIAVIPAVLSWLLREPE